MSRNLLNHGGDRPFKHFSLRCETSVYVIECKHRLRHSMPFDGCHCLLLTRCRNSRSDTHLFLHLIHWAQPHHNFHGRRLFVFLHYSCCCFCCRCCCLAGEFARKSFVVVVGFEQVNITFAGHRLKLLDDVCCSIFAEGYNQETKLFVIFR